MANALVNQCVIKGNVNMDIQRYSPESPSAENCGTNGSYTNQLADTMAEFRRNGQLCDVIISTEEKAFQAHKIILAASSSFFQSLFTVDMSEKNKQTIKMDNIDPATMTLVLDYIYTGVITNPNSDDARELYLAADYLILPGLKHKAVEIMVEALSPENCLRTLVWSHRFSSRALFTHTFRFILDNFNSVSRTADFVKLSARDLKLLLSCNNLRVPDEEVVYEALKRWCEEKSDERWTQFAELFKLIKLEHLSGYYIENTIQDDVLALPDEEVRFEILETITEYTVSENLEHSTINPLAPPRRHIAMVTCVLTPDVYAYIPTSKEWLEMAAVPTPRIFSSSAIFNGLVYNVGGLASSDDSSNVVECFDPSANSWLSKASLPVPTRAAAVKVLDGFLYVVGGRSNSVRFNIVQRYDPCKDNWTLVTSLHEERSGASLVSCHGNLYAIGGRKDENTFLRSVECYSPSQNTWTLTTPMNVARASSAAAYIQDKIYVIGGVRAPGVSHNSCETYDTTLDQWNMISSNIVPRSYAGIAAFDTTLLICGGEDSGNFHDTVECYDIEKDRWEIVDKMPRAEKFVDCCPMFISKDLLPIFPCVKSDFS
ncbi:kelch-like ECH-associated protein 1 [Dendronephthya gigantea]|uniref:kelch-like ECH-associated protein 1 n=1 Tax=Dendronephthya gigantea TaxID=151771 RepID=UPI00106CF54C|nr:kelch-like ECH-associated protein 1 [Dendronephthya gigantea]